MLKTIRQKKIYPVMVGKFEDKKNCYPWYKKYIKKQKNNENKFSNANCNLAFLSLNKFGSKYNLIQKMFWVFALVVSYGICIWQVYLSIIQFLSYPIGVSVTVEPIEEFDFPAITICPIRSKSTQNFNFTKPLSLRCKDKNSTCLSSLEFLNISAIDLWNDEEVHFIKEYTGDRRQKTYKNTAKLSYVNTHLGKCLLLYLDEKFLYSGKGRRRWTIFVEGINTFARSSFDMVFSLHSSKVVDRYNTFGDPLEKNKYRYAELYMKKLHRINTKQKPCLNEEKVVDCINRCFDSMFKTKNIFCKLPYVETINLDFCKSLEEVNNFQTYEIEMQENWKCDHCPRPCDTILYTIDNKLMEEVSNRKFENASIVCLVMWRPFCDIVTEFFAYPFTELLTNLAGNVGFFLGISLLNLFEVFHGTLIHCHKDK